MTLQLQSVPPRHLHVQDQTGGVSRPLGIQKGLCEFEYRSLVPSVGREVSNVAHQLLDELSPQDKLAVFRYSDKETLADFSQPRDTLDAVFYSLARQLDPVKDRKAIVVVGSGVDCFSKTTYQEALRSLPGCGTPVYAIGMSGSDVPFE